MNVKERLVSMRKRDLVLSVFAVTLAVGLILGYVFSAISNTGSLTLPFLSMHFFDKPTGTSFDKPVAGFTSKGVNITQRVEQYVNTNFLTPNGASGKVTNMTTLGDILLLTVAVTSNGATSDVLVYATANGEFLLVGVSYVYNLSAPLPTPELEPQEPTQTVPKTVKPNVTLFVMSFCPYGQQAENTVWPVLDLLKDKVNFDLHYVVYSGYCGYGVRDCDAAKYAAYCLDGSGEYCSMHGADEMKENLRQMCVLKTYGVEVWRNYVNAINTGCSYSNVGTCWEGVAKNVGVDSAVIKKCYDENALTLAASEKALNDKYGVQGSPALFINGVEFGGSRTPDAYKAAVCGAFANVPSECNTTLSTTDSTASGGCG
jgi:glutaredoxin